jgi:hypothetical protein
MKLFTSRKAHPAMRGLTSWQCAVKKVISESKTPAVACFLMQSKVPLIEGNFY